MHMEINLTIPYNSKILGGKSKGIKQLLISRQKMK